MRSYWKCNFCGNTSDYEKEVICWDCGTGEMIHIVKSDKSYEGLGIVIVLLTCAGGLAMMYLKTVWGVVL